MDLDWGAIVALLDARAVLMIAIGVAVGVVGGSVPGISIALTMALALPFTVALDPVEALALLIGIYKGGQFGGSISAILFNVPGTPAAAATLLDGYPLARSGRPRRALRTALWSSVTADVVSDAVLIVSFAPLALVALRFGSRELLALLVVALVSVGAIGSRSVGRAAIGAGIGLLLSAVGRDPILGTPRLDLGLTVLRDGIGLVPLLVGLFAMAEMMERFALLRLPRVQGDPTPEMSDRSDDDVVALLRAGGRDDRLTVREWLGTWRETGIGALIGTFLGALPGPGATLATFASYGIAGRLRRNRGRFGTGTIEGVAAAESGNSATSGATLIPLFGLGVPGDALAAVMAAALSLQGLTPGPSMAREHGDVVAAFFVLLMVGSIMNLFLGRALIPVFIAISRVPVALLVPALVLVSVLGVTSLTSSPDAVVLTAAVGVLGFLLRRNGVPASIVVIAFIVGPLLEVNLRRSLILADGDLLYLLRSPIAIGAYVIALVAIVALRRTARRSEESDASRSA